MNEASKLMAAAALVALGLGLAYLCGPPADSPQVVRGFADAGMALQLGPLGTAASSVPLRLHADALPPEETLAGARSLLRKPETCSDEATTERVILSAVEAEVRTIPPQSEEPTWHAPSVKEDDRELIPPRPVKMDNDAAPLSAVVTPPSSRDASPDDWLLAPPAIPRSYNAQSATGIVASSHADNRANDHADTEASAWWTRDIPRLQGLNANRPPDHTAPHPSSLPSSKLVPLHPKPSNTSLAAPIDLSNASEQPPAAPSPAPYPTRPAPAAIVAVPQPTRTHLIADGDSLARLAERYLGDASRAGEILQLNSEVLRNPDLLPIGSPLRIPASADRSEPESDPGEAPSTSTGRLVPVVEVLSAAELQPHARLQTPASIAASGW